MEQVATNGNRSSQQQQEFHHRLHPKRATDRMGTPSSSRTMFRIKEPDRRRILVQHATKQINSHPRSQQDRPQSKHSSKSLDNWTTRMARREEPTTAARYRQTHTPTTRPIQSHENRLPSSGSTQTPASVEHSPGLSQQPTDALH
jgi:hypothetical protein